MDAVYGVPIALFKVADEKYQKQGDGFESRFASETCNK